MSTRAKLIALSSVLACADYATRRTAAEASQRRSTRQRIGRVEIRAAIDADIQATPCLLRTMAFALRLYRDGLCAIFDKEPRQRNEKYSFSKAFNHRAKTT